MVHSSQEEMLNEKGSMGNGLLCCMGFGSCCPGERESVGGLVGLTAAIVNSSNAAIFPLKSAGGQRAVCKIANHQSD